MGFCSEGRLASTNHRFPHCDLVLQHIPHPLTKTNKKKESNTPVLEAGPPLLWIAISVLTKAREWRGGKNLLP